MHIDHVIYVADDLAAATSRLEAQLGLRAAGGGRHEGMGTHNAILPLGGGYLEVLAVADAAEASGSPLGAALARRIADHGDGLFGWAVAVDDVDAVARRLGTAVVEIRREGFGARLAGVAEAMADASLPFFIERDAGVPDPGKDGDAGGITWVETTADLDRVTAWLGDDALPVRRGEGTPGVVAMGIGDRELRTG